MLTIFSINSTKYEESEYVLFLIKAIKKYSSKIVACMHSDAESKLMNSVSALVDETFSYDTYIDINKWKDVIVNKLGRDLISEADSLLLINDSVFGPIYSLDGLFYDSNAEVDFWGLTEHGEIKGGEPGKIKIWPRFLQSYFLVINHKMLISDDFWTYIYELPEFVNFNEAAEGFEYVFTQYFVDKGYTWEARIITRDLENMDEVYFQSMIIFDINELIQKRHFPFIPKIIFDIDNSVYLAHSIGDDVRRVLEYVRREELYDLSLIYKNIIPKKNIHDLLVNLNLNYVIEEQSNPLHDKKIALFAYLFYEDLFEYSISKISNFPLNADVYLATNSVEKRNRLLEIINRIMPEHNVKILLHSCLGRDISALLITFKEYLMNYEIICFTHDKKSSQMCYSTIGSSYNEWLWDNTLYSKGYINGVINLLVNNPIIGFLCPPPVYHGTYFHTSINTWTICYDITRDLASRMGLSLQLDPNKGPDFLGSSFWCKTEALKKLFTFDFKETDFPSEPLPPDGSFNHAIERIFPYVAQESGYLSGIIMTKEYAQLNYNNYRECVLMLLNKLKNYDSINLATLESSILTMK